MLERGPNPGVSLFTGSELKVIREVDAGEIQNACIREACFPKELSPERQLTLVEYIKKGWMAKEELDRDGANPQKKEKLRFLIERGKDSRNELMATNSRLVVNRAKKQQNRGVELLDLNQEGHLGFDDAVKKFEPRKGYNFSTYFTWWIDQKIQRAIYTHGRTIRRPERLSTQIFKIKKTRDALRQTLNREPTDNEVMHKAKMTKRIYKNVTKAEKETIISLSDVENEEARGRTGFSRSKKSHCYSLDRPTEDIALANVMREQTKKIVKELPELESKVIDLYSEGLSNRSVAKKIQSTERRTGSVREKGLNRLRGKMKVVTST